MIFFSDSIFLISFSASIKWSNASPIRTIFREAFSAAILPYFNPHSFRNTLAILGEKVCRSAEEFKAWSQSLGHEKVLTTFCSYGAVSSSRQTEIFQKLKKPQEKSITEIEAIASTVVRKLHGRDVLSACD
jgi:integrase/recombinase XerD